MNWEAKQPRGGAARQPQDPAKMGACVGNVDRLDSADSCRSKVDELHYLREAECFTTPKRPYPPPPSSPN